MATTKNSIIYTQTVKTAVAVTTAAKTTLNDSTNAVLLVTAGSDGSLVKSITAIPRATVTATRLDLFLSKDGGTTLIYLKSKLQASHTVGNTAETIGSDFGYSDDVPLRLAPSDRLYVSAAVALGGGTAWVAQYEDF